MSCPESPTTDSKRRAARCASLAGDDAVFYSLRNTLSFCQVDGRLIFLDVRADRYFRLSGGLERSFIAFAKGERDTDVAALVARNILVTSDAAQAGATAANVEAPCRSALELPSPARLHPTSLIEVFISIFSMRRQLRTRPLERILESTMALRSYEPQSAPGFQPASSLEQRLIRAAGEFRLARAYAPAENRCLLDSLAMIGFLARRKLRASIVFGVTSEPFSAHCWVQAGDLVLNDTVGHASAHTPIRVI